MGGQAQNQTVDPAIQQITTHISNSINEGEDPIAVLAGLIEQQVDQNIIGQAFMVAGYQEEDVIALFEEFQKQSQPPGPASEQEQTRDPQEIARNQAMEKAAIEEEAQQEQQLMAQQEAMSQQLQAKSGIEIKPENKGKFTAWAKARGLSVPDAYNKVMNNTKGYSPSVVKMANFAKNAASWSKKEGGEFTSHIMYKGDKSQKAESYQQHLKLKELGYTHENKAQVGKETTADEDFYNKTGVVKRKDKLTIAPNYVNPIAFESNDNFNIGQVGATLKGGFDTMLSGKDKNEDGVKDGSFRDWKRKGDIQKEKKGDYYNYEVKVDPNDPNKYGYDNLDLYNTSKGNGGLRNLQTFTNDVNKYSRVNFNPETGEYDALISSRKLNDDIYGEKRNRKGKVTREANNALAGENLNYFNDVDADTRELILGTQDDPEGITLGINELGQASSYAPDADNPYYYDTMMGRNEVGVNTTMDETQNSMIPTNSNGQPQQGMFTSSEPRVENDDFHTWFKYGGNLPKAQAGIPTRADSTFLLNNNAIIQDYIDKGYEWATHTPIDKDKWEYKSKDSIKNKINEIIDLDKKDKTGNIQKAKERNAYISNVRNMYGTQDWLGGGGEDAHMPFQYLHPGIIPQFEGDLWKSGSNTGEADSSVYSYGYDQLAITPWSDLSPEEQKDRVEKYGTASTPYADGRPIPEGWSVPEETSKRTTPDPKRSVSDNLTSMGMDNSFENRKKLYIEEAGLGDTYGGTKEENIALNEFITEGGFGSTGTSVDDPDHKGIGTADGNHERYTPTAEELLLLSKYENESINPPIEIVETPTPINNLETKRIKAYLNSQDPQEYSLPQPPEYEYIQRPDGSFILVDVKETPPLVLPVGGVDYKSGGSTSTSFSKWMKNNNLPKAQEGMPTVTPSLNDPKYTQMLKSFGVTVDYDPIDSTYRVKDYGDPEKVYMGFPELPTYKQLEEASLLDLLPSWWEIQLQNQQTDPYKNGGSTNNSLSKWMKNNNLPKAQVGEETIFNLPDNLFGNLYSDAQQEGMGDYFTDMTKTDYIKDTQAVADAQLQNKQPELGITPQQQEIENLNLSTPPLNISPTFEQPTVERTNKFEGSVNRAMDNRGVKAFADVSEFAVNAAGVVNNWFKDKRVNDAKVDNKNKLGADYIYGTNENPFLNRGGRDANTDTFSSESDRTVQTNIGIAQRGAEISSKTIDVDSTLLAKLIAAGADIEIL